MYKFATTRTMEEALQYYSGGSMKLDRMEPMRKGKWEAVERDLKSRGYSPMEYVHYMGRIKENNDIGVALLTYTDMVCSSAFFDDFLATRETRKDHVNLICQMQRRDAYRRASTIPHKYEVFTSDPKLRANDIMKVEITLGWRDEIPRQAYDIINPIWGKVIKLLEAEPEYLSMDLTPNITEYLAKEGVIIKDE